MSSPKISDIVRHTVTRIWRGDLIKTSIFHSNSWVKDSTANGFLEILDYSFQSGEVYAITGPNGSGKSTLMQILWGQMPPSTGSIKYKISGTDISQEDIYRHVAVATPYLDLIEEFTLEEQLRFHFKFKP